MGLKDWKIGCELLQALICWYKYVINHGVFMIQVTQLRKPSRTVFYSILTFSVVLLLGFAQASFAEGVFENRQKANHALGGAEFNRLSVEHKMRFGAKQSAADNVRTNNPWEKKKQKSQRPVQKASWGECRDFALTKRNYCYREGKSAYSCEQVYEARTRLCDKTL